MGLRWPKYVIEDAKVKFLKWHWLIRRYRLIGYYEISEEKYFRKPINNLSENWNVGV
jgi:hypothetical protein